MHLLEVAAFDFRFRAREPMRMPGYMGSAWRGGFGRALRRAACITGLSTCPACPLEATCVYPYLFETAPGGEGGILAGYDRVPGPFVLAPPWNAVQLLQAGDEAGLRLVLIGRAIEHAGFAKQAVVEAGLRGLGPDRGALDLVSVDPITLPEAGPCPEAVAITLSSPLRLVEAGRQRSLLQMGGLLGSLSLTLTGLEPFWPFIVLAPWVHVGKGTTMGLGALRVSRS
jgi:hypothetical protein